MSSSAQRLVCMATFAEPRTCIPLLTFLFLQSDSLNEGKADYSDRNALFQTEVILAPNYQKIFIVNVIFRKDGVCALSRLQTDFTFSLVISKLPSEPFWYSYTYVNVDHGGDC